MPVIKKSQFFPVEIPPFREYCRFVLGFLRPAFLSGTTVSDRHQPFLAPVTAKSTLRASCPISFEARKTKTPKFDRALTFPITKNFTGVCPTQCNLSLITKITHQCSKKVKHYADMLMSLPVSCKTCSQPQTACEQAMPGVATT